VNSEATADAFGTWSTAEYTRAWDVAGATHASLYGSQYVDDITVWDQSILSRDGTPITSFTEWIEPSCEMLPVFSTVDSGLVLSRAIDAVRNWIRTGEPAAPSRRFERDPITGMVLRDVDGFAEYVGGKVRHQGNIAHIRFIGPFGPVDRVVACEVNVVRAGV